MKIAIFVLFALVLSIIGYFSNFWVPKFFSFLIKNEIIIQTLSDFLQIVAYILSVISFIFSARILLFQRKEKVSMNVESNDNFSEYHIKQIIKEKKNYWKNLSEQIESLNQDLGIESDSFRRRNLNIRKNIIEKEREKVSAELKDLESQLNK